MSELVVTFEGERIPARPGESLAAALTAHGVRAFRTTRGGRERGLFCGMGVCQECLVDVDGKPNQRACMVKVDRPMTVRRDAHLRPLPPPAPPLPPATVEDIRVATPDILVIGAGPSGLA